MTVRVRVWVVGPVVVMHGPSLVRVGSRVGDYLAVEKIQTLEAGARSNNYLPFYTIEIITIIMPAKQI